MRQTFLRRITFVKVSTASVSSTAGMSSSEGFDLTCASAFWNGASTPIYRRAKIYVDRSTNDHSERNSEEHHCWTQRFPEDRYCSTVDTVNTPEPLAFHCEHENMSHPYLMYAASHQDPPTGPSGVSTFKRCPLFFGRGDDRLNPHMSKRRIVCDGHCGESFIHTGTGFPGNWVYKCHGLDETQTNKSQLFYRHNQWEAGLWNATWYCFTCWQAAMEDLTSESWLHGRIISALDMERKHAPGRRQKRTRGGIVKGGQLPVNHTYATRTDPTWHAHVKEQVNDPLLMHQHQPKPPHFGTGDDRFNWNKKERKIVCDGWCHQTYSLGVFGFDGCWVTRCPGLTPAMNLYEEINHRKKME